MTIIRTEVDATIELFLICECGKSLTAREEINYYGNKVLLIEPCSTCLYDSHKEGYDEGQKDAREELENTGKL